MNPISKILVIIAFFIVLLAGVLPSFIKDDWMWFSRSGALLTAYGILITFMDIKATLDRWSADIKTRIDNHLKAHDLSKVPQEEMGKIEQYKEHILNEMILSSKWTEFWILFFGTIIWGYGDLLNP